MTREQLLATDELDAILHALPPELVQRVRGLERLDGLLEIVMDLGRLPEARFTGREEILSQREVTAEDIAFVISRIGQFGGDNRAGIERTLHRISALRNRAGKVVGLTLRVGRDWSLAGAETEVCEIRDCKDKQRDTEDCERLWNVAVRRQGTARRNIENDEQDVCTEKCRNDHRNAFPRHRQWVLPDQEACGEDAEAEGDIDAKIHRRQSLRALQTHHEERGPPERLRRARKAFNEVAVYGALHERADLKASPKGTHHVVGY